MSTPENDTKLRPLCFVLMPFAKKTDTSGAEIDFDSVYSNMIRPAVEAAGCEPIRADEERDGGIIHKPMFERLLLCPYAVADLTLANANVFYELGVRHAVRPHSTLLLYAPSSQRLPFDVAPLRAIPYELKDGTPDNVDEVRKQITDRLMAARDPAPDSPLIQLLEDYEPPPLHRLKPHVFRERVRYAEGIKSRTAAARARHDIDAVATVEAELSDLNDVEAGVLVDLILTYRDLEGWDRMTQLVERLPRVVAETTLVQEQYAFALNRAGHHLRAAGVLDAVVARSGPSSESMGLLGRVYKDLWKAAVQGGRQAQAGGYLERAIAAYRKGFEADWRDAYPGINLLTLLAVRNPADPEIGQLAPVVGFARERRSAAPDYWDHATSLELAVITRDDEAQRIALSSTLSELSEPWQLESTAANLDLHAGVRGGRGEDIRLLRDAIEALREEAERRRRG
jgi:hypothetical protein